jgi:hypothetical protein
MKDTHAQYNGNQTVYSGYKNVESKTHVHYANIRNSRFITHADVKYQVYEINIHL